MTTFTVLPRPDGLYNLVANENGEDTNHPGLTLAQVHETMKMLEEERNFKPSHKVAVTRTGVKVGIVRFSHPDEIAQYTVNLEKLNRAIERALSQAAEVGM